MSKLLQLHFTDGKTKGSRAPAGGQGQTGGLPGTVTQTAALGGPRPRGGQGATCMRSCQVRSSESSGVAGMPGEGRARVL